MCQEQDPYIFFGFLSVTHNMHMLQCLYLLLPFTLCLFGLSQGGSPNVFAIYGQQDSQLL
jgi:hypothetical protein